MPVRPLRAAARRGSGAPHPGVVDRSRRASTSTPSRATTSSPRCSPTGRRSRRSSARRAARRPSTSSTSCGRSPPRDTPGRRRCCTPTRRPTRATGSWSRRRSPRGAWPSSGRRSNGSATSCATRWMLRPQPVDLVAAYSVPIPTRTIATALGVPDERYLDFKRWADAEVAAIGRQLDDDAWRTVGARGRRAAAVLRHRARGSPPGTPRRPADRPARGPPHPRGRASRASRSRWRR